MEMGLLVRFLEGIHLTSYFFAIFSASSIALGLLLYHIATLAPASARACATDNPMPAPAPETMAVRPLSEKRAKTPLASGAVVLLWEKSPPFIEPSMLTRVELESGL
jgi:hypothetical protein